MTLWSKRHDDGSPYPLISHLLDTAASATVLWDDWLRPGLRDLIKDSLGPDARAWVAAAAGLHDIGKANPVFAGQLAVRSAEPWHERTRKSLVEAGFDLDVPVERVQSLRRHEKVSGLSLTRTDLDFGDRIAEDWIAAAALGHHGKFQIPETPECRAFTRSAGGAWQDSREDLTAQVMAACGLNPGAALPEAPPTVAVLIAGLVVLADRTASEWISVKRANEELRSGSLNLDDHAGWMRRRATFFASRLKRTIGTYTDFSDARISIAGDYDLRPLQEAALTAAGDGLWIAMAPTGNGKTEAALLRHSTARERLVFALPTQATTNAMMKRVQAAYRGTGNVAELAHRLATIEDFYAQAAEHRTADGARLIPSEFLRNGTARLLAPVSVSTIDQVLAGSLRTKWAHLRLLTLANAHVVIDEAHLMDQYQSALAAQLMSWWGATGTRITLLSATLPRWQRDSFATAYDPTWEPSEITFPSHETIPGIQESLSQDSYQISITTTEAESSVEAHANWVAAMKTQAPQARLGIVVNTVGRAQETAEALQVQGITPILLHSRMTAGHRRDTANRLLAEIGKGGPGAGTVLIGTQAIEASLDIDLDAMSTDLAPAPSLIQRAGRVWRHHDPRRGDRHPHADELPLHVVCVPGKWGAMPYFRSELDRVHNYLTGRTHLRMPEDSQAFVEASTLRLDEIDWTAQEEMTEHARRFAKAGGVVINVNELTDPDADLETLMRLTGHDVDEETATRLIEPPTATALIIDPDGRAGAPAAWAGTLMDLERIDPNDRGTLRTAMEATVPINGKLARRALEIGNHWDPESLVLQGITPIIIGQAGLGYDSLLGLIDLDAD